MSTSMIHALRFVLFLLVSVQLWAEVLPAGSAIELRLLGPVGSRTSHAGDPIEALVIAPVTREGEVLIPAGATITGRIQSVGRLGLGLKRARATIQLQFDTLHLPDGPNFPIHTRLAQVQTAKEKVNANGVIGGIRPGASLPATASYYVLPILCLDPDLGLPVLAVKFLIARSPDSEIYFPRGTEFFLEVVDPLQVSAMRKGNTGNDVRPLSASDLDSARELLGRLPMQQAEHGSNHPSDLLNIFFLGTRDQLNRAFRAAGWSGAQDRSLVTIYRMYHCMIQRTSYSAAPMGKLKLNGMIADVDYQKSLDTFSKRHHIRLWKQPNTDVWLSAATEDVSYRIHRGHLTHASDPHIDDERAKVLNDLAFTGCLESAGLMSRDWAVQPDPDSTPVQTDGKMAVLRLNDCLHPRTMPEPTPDNRGQPRRIVQILEAIRTDLIRSNPVSLAFNMRRMVEETPSYGLNTFRMRRTVASQIRVAGSSPSEQEAESHRWIRSSVLDASDSGVQ
ncbi:MAG: LssY C-terminal domain-containing protein [Bryobacteraceae bacterium]